MSLFFPREKRKALAADHHNIEVRPKNWLTPVALVLLREESSYAYALMERLEEEFGFEQILPGTLYKTLRWAPVGQTDPLVQPATFGE